MFRIKKRKHTALALVFGCLGGLTACEDQPVSAGGGDPADSGKTVRTEIEDLGEIHGRSFHEGRAVNNLGQITGVSRTTEPPESHSFFLWDEQGGMADLGRFKESAGGTVIPHAINDHGEIAGQDHPYAVIWSPASGFRVLGEGAAFGLNNNGLAVGYRTWPVGSQPRPLEGTQALLWDETGDQVVLETFSEKSGEPVERDWNQAFDINSHGQVVGYSVFPSGPVSGPRRAVIWEDAKIEHDLGTFGGSSEAFAINDSGQVVGQSEIEGGPASRNRFFTVDSSMGKVSVEDGPRRAAEPGYSQIVMANRSRAFIWDERNGMVNLGTKKEGPSLALDINNHGQVVGFILIPPDSARTNQVRAFYWDEDLGMTILEPLDESFSFSFAYGINDEGIVTGRSSSARAGHMQAVRWKISFEGEEIKPRIISVE
ncbi:MAG: DUF3466 family protein [Balneolaceae bacterium]